MAEDIDFMVPKPSAAGRWRMVRWICIALFSVVVVLMAFYIRKQRDRANWSEACGNMYQMALGLTSYEEENGTLPPLSLSGADGKPIHSWRGVILQFLNENSQFEESWVSINFSEPWDSKSNQKIYYKPFNYMSSFGVDTSKKPLRTKLLAYVGEKSIWTKEGMPRGKAKDYPDAICFIWVEKSDIHPMQPGDITDKEIRTRLEGGEDVLYGAVYGSTRKYGRVVKNNGELVFLSSSESWK